MVLKGLIITGIMTLFSVVVNIIGDTLEPIIPVSIFNVVVVAIVLSAFAFYIKNKLKKEPTDRHPSTVVLLMEFFKDSVDGLVSDTMGVNRMGFGPYMFTLFIFLLVSNLIGVLGITNPTSNYSVTLALALLTFGMTQYFGLKSQGFDYIKGFFDPWPLTPLNIIGELANPVSLSFRLFGNLMAGGLIMTLATAALGLLAPAVAPFLQMYFEIFSGVLQAFIFTMLSMVFIGGAFGDND